MDLGTQKAVAQLLVMQQLFLRGQKGCGSKGGSGKSSCGSLRGKATCRRRYGKGKNHPATAKKRITTMRACTWPWRQPATSNATTATANTIAQ